MPKFTFICEDDPMPFSEGVTTKRTIEFDAVLLNDVVSEFELFLRGAGFNPPGILDFIDENYYAEPAGPEWQTEEFVTPTTEHSSHFFDTERNK
jgi:hypothetical protein